MQPRPDPCCGPDAEILGDGVPDRRYFRTPATAPGPSGPQMLAVFPAIGADTLGFLRRLRGRYGPVVQFPVPQPPTFLVDDPHLARSVLMAFDADFDKDTIQYRALAMVTGDGLLAAPNALWKQQRPIVQPAFHKRVLDRLVADTAAAVDRLVARWDRAPAGSIVDADPAMMRLGLEVVGEHLFDADLVHDAPRLAAATLDALDAVIAAARPPWSVLKGLPTPVHQRYRRALADLDGAVDALVGARRAGPAPEAPDDLLSLLLAAYPDDPKTVRDQIITFLVAGHETVASALTWTLGLWAHNPHEQEAAAAEAAAVLCGGAAGIADLAALPVVRACFDEALRLYPPAWIITRSATRRIVLGGREVPAGSLIIISPWLMHRDAGRWPLPDAFLPQRFAGRPGAAARAATTRAEYLPFGTGQRLCIGRDFALTEAAVVLAALAQRYRFAPAADRLPRTDPLVTLRAAGGMPLRIERR